MKRAEKQNTCIECGAKLPNKRSNVCINCLEKILTDTQE